MSEDEVKETTEAADVEVAEGAPKQWVVWDHRWEFESRGLTRSDLIGLGAEEPEGETLQAIEWNTGNRHRVPREAVPLSDLQLGALLGTDHNFRLVER